MRIYIAGPEVFLENADEIGEAKKAICAKYGFEGAWPLESGAAIDGDKLTFGRNISRANETMIRSCQAVIANMTPFRGVSMDVGTAFEIGFAKALGLPIMGYTATAVMYNERMRRLIPPFPQRNARGDLLDDDRMFVEDFDMHDNLMIDGAILESGGEVIVATAEGKTRYGHLIGFEACVSELAKRFKGSP